MSTPAARPSPATYDSSAPLVSNVPITYARRTAPVLARTTPPSRPPGWHGHWVLRKLLRHNLGVGRLEECGHLPDFCLGADQWGRKTDGVANGTYEQTVLGRFFHNLRSHGAFTTIGTV